MKKNNKGFTLIELLAVLVILIAIITIAIPSITSSIERSKDKEIDAKKMLIISAAELFMSNNKAKYTGTDSVCKIEIEQLEKGKVLLKSDIKDPRTNEAINGCVTYKKNDNTYEFTDPCSVSTKCIPTDN